MEAKSVKLHYLTIRGYGEIARLLFLYSDTKYEEVLYERNTTWQEVKTSMPLHHVPILELDGVQYPQSYAIWCYLAKMFGLYPAHPKDQMIVDIVGMTYFDLTGVLISFYSLKDPEEIQKNKEESWPKAKVFLDYLEKLLSDSDSDYFVEGRLTLADFMIFDMITGLHRHLFGPLTPGGVCEVADLKDRYPCMAKTFDLLMANEKIAAHMNTRPDSVY